MNLNVFYKKIPNPSLFLGYAFILSIMVMFGFVQYSSSHNIKEINSQMRLLTLMMANRKEEQPYDKLIEEYNRFLEADVFYNLYSTFQSSEEFHITEEITNIEDLITNLGEIGTILDFYESDLYRSQIILLMTFIGLSIILSILITVAEFDQRMKYENEKRQRFVDQKLMEVLENERNLIAIELHDDVAQKLSVLGQHFDSPENSEHSEILKRYNADVIHKIRTMAQGLRTPDVSHESFQKQLEFLFSDFRSISDIQFQNQFNGLSALKIQPDRVLHIYRIIQELLNNCRNHSDAKNLNIYILYVHPLLNILYKDDGIGLNLNDSEKGLGLKSIKYRLNLLNAQMKIDDENGLSINIKIPVSL